MPEPTTTPECRDTPPTQFEVDLSNGARLCCPFYPQDCEWLAVHRYGRETYRVTAAALAASPVGELTRMADALSDGRPANPDLPVTFYDGEPGNYGLESAVSAVATGRTLRFASAGREVDYLRVCGPTGEEVAYWVRDEFAEDAADVLGATVGCLASTGALA